MSDIRIITTAEGWAVTVKRLPYSPFGYESALMLGYSVLDADEEAALGLSHEVGTMNCMEKGDYLVAFGNEPPTPEWCEDPWCGEPYTHHIHNADPSDQEIWDDLSSRYGGGWDDSTDLRSRGE